MNDEHVPSLRFFLIPELSVLRVEGPDAIPFLQGQVTCDVQGLAQGAVTLGALCTPQGRAIAVFRLIRDEGSCTLILRTDILDTVRTRLQRYVLRAKVTLCDLGGQWQVYGLLGNLDTSVAASLELSETPAPGCSVTAGNHCRLLCVDRADKHLLLTPGERPEALREVTRNRSADLTDPSCEWELAEIRDGIPVVVPETSEEFVPQMLNLDQLGGIAFDKGCYTGQEVVARTHYLGSIKRRMRRFRLCSPQAPNPGDRLITDHDRSPSGHVVRSARVSGSDFELLAVVQEAQTSEPVYRLNVPDGPRLQRLADC